MFELNFDKNDSIDHDKLSRQIRTYGIEITKNIILSNPYKVAIFDDEICKINDLGCNYFLTKENVTKKERRDEACLKKLSDLNPATRVYIENNYFSQIKDFDVVIITEMMKSDIIKKINKECHENNKGFIYTFSFPVLSKIVWFSPKSLKVIPINPKEKVYINPLLFS